MNLSEKTEWNPPAEGMKDKAKVLYPTTKIMRLQTKLKSLLIIYAKSRTHANRKEARLIAGRIFYPRL